ncbi:hypothetical protein METHB2_50055 [Candidatus Methylobacter favarea]|uniref:Tn3 transposase DDE domain-containing protein n=1 Tax=Candidatus Methylobacter favarea TaxID=2707345 RepID=A0A8S0X922_9GAMM|nr:hypothetical protein METHB2_50055 [Candidatus Methylobacter favarea]
MQVLYCPDNPALYEKFLIKPSSEIEIEGIANQKPNIDQVAATLGLKERIQGRLIAKLCIYIPPNPMRRAIFEFDKLIRSIYTRGYLRSANGTQSSPLPKPY